MRLAQAARRRPAGRLRQRSASEIRDGRRVRRTGSGEDMGAAIATGRKVLETVGLIVTPFALISGLLYYFGWVRTGAIFSHFGVEQTMLGYSSQDYLLRSAGVAFRPVASLLLAAAVAIAVHRTLAALYERWERLRIPIIVILGATGSLLLVIGVATLFGILVLTYPLLAALGLVAGAFAVESVGTLWLNPRSSRIALLVRRLLIAGMVVIASFWSCAIYAQNVGSRLAAGWAADLSRRPEVIIYSSQDLQLTGPGLAVLNVSSEKAEGGYRYRYSGMRLLVYSNQRWFLLPQGWRPDGTTPTLIIADNDRIRVEVRPGR